MGTINVELGLAAVESNCLILIVGLSSSCIAGYLVQRAVLLQRLEKFSLLASKSFLYAIHDNSGRATC